MAMQFFFFRCPAGSVSCSYVALNINQRMMKCIHHPDTHFHPPNLNGPFSTVAAPIAAIIYTHSKTLDEISKFRILVAYIEKT